MIAVVEINTYILPSRKLTVASNTADEFAADMFVSSGLSSPRNLSNKVFCNHLRVASLAIANRIANCVSAAPCESSNTRS